MKMKILSWLFLIMCSQAIAFVACYSVKGDLSSTDMNVKPRTGDVEQHPRDVEAVGHNSGGARGGSDLMKKPSKDKNGATYLPVKNLGGISFCFGMVVNCCFFLLV